jgi:hypothetical protein
MGKKTSEKSEKSWETDSQTNSNSHILKQKV